MPAPIVIAHRGASGYLPEHTLAAYFVAIEQGADYIEPDLVMTRDGVLVARHENEISGTTDVARHAAFAARRTTKAIDGAAVTGWFTEDFTLAELKQLRAVERIPQWRPGNTRFDGMFEIPTLEEILALAHGRQVRALSGARVGVYPETKHPTYFRDIGLPMEQALVDTLHRYGYAGRDGRAFIQSFEIANLRALRGMTQLPLVQLVNDSGQPFDAARRGDATRYADLVTPGGLAEVARYADAVGVHKNLVIARTAGEALGPPAALVDQAHAAGLLVHAWTFRAENVFLPAPQRRPGPEATPGALDEEIEAFLRAGVDGIFSDHPDYGVRARHRVGKESAD